MVTLAPLGARLGAMSDAQEALVPTPSDATRVAGALRAALDVGAERAH